MTPTQTIQTKYENAIKSVEAFKAEISKLARHSASSAEIGKAVQSLAFAEGELTVWSRLNGAAKSHSEKGEELPSEKATQIIIGLLSLGADDSWSGRSNDIARCRFDGVRDAAADVEFLF